MKVDSLKRWYTAKEVAEIFSAPVRTVYYYAKVGALPTVAFGSGIRFPKARIDEIARFGLPASAVERAS